MSNQDTRVGGIRLHVDDWAKLRALMRFYRGRAWLEKIIRREHKKAIQSPQNPASIGLIPAAKSERSACR